MEQKVKLSERHLRKLLHDIQNSLLMINNLQSSQSLEETERAGNREYVVSVTEAVEVREQKPAKSKKVEVHEG